MKIGIYINGLGQSVADENGLDYVTRLTNEMNKNDDDFDYHVKLEKVEYTAESKSNLVSIIKVDKKSSANEIVYKFYEFQYGGMLTKSYNDKNIIYKNYSLFSIVLTKFPILLWRIIKPTKQYHSAFQTLYIFSLFFLIALSILLMIPSTLSLFLNDNLVTSLKSISWIYNPIHNLGIERKDVIHISQIFVPVISLIMLIIPKANVFITGLATEFVSAHLYLQYAQQKGIILGNLDLLYEYIANHETEPEVYIHAYSFGSLIALDYLYPYKSKLTGNTLKRTKGLITIGAPFDFINTYYPNYYNSRGNDIELKEFKWLNTYSITDALASNFRNDSKAGAAEYGIIPGGILPYNIDYEIIVTTNFGFISYMFLNNLKVHGMYWSESTNGKSCLDPIYMKMVELKMI
ncbi:MAG: hypothetical protein RL427_476 [Bacteroidota bacterium]